MLLEGKAMASLAATVRCLRQFAMDSCLRARGLVWPERDCSCKCNAGPLVASLAALIEFDSTIPGVWKQRHGKVDFVANTGCTSVDFGSRLCELFHQLM